MAVTVTAIRVIAAEPGGLTGRAPANFKLSDYPESPTSGNHFDSRPAAQSHLRLPVIRVGQLPTSSSRFSGGGKENGHSRLRKLKLSADRPGRPSHRQCAP